MEGGKLLEYNQLDKQQLEIQLFISTRTKRNYIKYFQQRSILKLIGAVNNKFILNFVRCLLSELLKFNCGQFKSSIIQQLNLNSVVVTHYNNLPQQQQQYDRQHVKGLTVSFREDVVGLE
ncbi:Hypothetical_protein [Hexamita inflata]|uniref:Hypothetical_protein n=1 Tax=Hexamita inflata TaxID=28002 RepID=A0AA86N8K9_9EUKA|nr:Hypothetical protein HINF_LOCUS2366 [Hexamita inflata]